VTVLVDREGLILKVYVDEPAVPRRRGRTEPDGTLVGLEERICPLCGRRSVVEVCRGPLYLPPTGGDYEWVDMDGEARCEACGGRYAVRFRLSADGEWLGFV
jgi:hypothetical protein